MPAEGAAGPRAGARRLPAPASPPQPPLPSPPRGKIQREVFPVTQFEVFIIHRSQRGRALTHSGKAHAVSLLEAVNHPQIIYFPTVLQAGPPAHWGLFPQSFTSGLELQRGTPYSLESQEICKIDKEQNRMPDKISCRLFTILCLRDLSSCYKYLLSTYNETGQVLAAFIVNEIGALKGHVNWQAIQACICPTAAQLGKYHPSVELERSEVGGLAQRFWIWWVVRLNFLS